MKKLMTRTRIGVAFVFLLLLGLVVYQAVDRAAQSIRLSLAKEQCQIFAWSADEAVSALGSEPPDAHESVEHLKYVHRYYPSGTKQIAGSQLDAIVENCRRASELRIIEVLKAKTGSDLGDDASAWIEHFAGIDVRPHDVPVQ